MNCRRDAEIPRAKTEIWQDKNLMIQIRGGVYRVGALPRSDDPKTRDVMYCDRKHNADAQELKDAKSASHLCW
jgi:hypothetical protein